MINLSSAIPGIEVRLLYENGSIDTWQHIKCEVCAQYGSWPIELSPNHRFSLVYARLDLHTMSDATVKSKLEQLSSSDISWKTLSGITNSVTKLITIASQLSVLLAVFRREKGGIEFAVLALIQPMVLMLGTVDDPMPNGGGMYICSSECWIVAHSTRF